MSKALDLHISTENTLAVIQGLAVAKSLVRSRFLEAFDQGGTAVLCLLLADIDQTMDELGSLECARNITDSDARATYLKALHCEGEEMRPE